MKEGEDMVYMVTIDKAIEEGVFYDPSSEEDSS